LHEGEKKDTSIRYASLTKEVSQRRSINARSPKIEDLIESRRKKGEGSDHISAGEEREKILALSHDQETKKKNRNKRRKNKAVVQMDCSHLSDR